MHCKVLAHFRRWAKAHGGLQRVYRRLDKGGNGKLSRAEFRKARAPGGLGDAARDGG